MTNLLVSSITDTLGVQIEAVILLSSVIATYLICLIYALYLRNKSRTFKSIYFLLTGSILVFLAYGLEGLHSLINCLVCYITLKCLPKRIALTINIIFTMAYLCYGYLLTQISWDYTLTWTMPQCILTLRLIAFSFDVYDQTKPNDQLTSSSSSRLIITNIEELPTFLDYLSYCYFPPAFFVGPLIPYVSYDNLLKTTDYDRSKIQTSLQRLFGGIVILIIYLIGSKYWPVDYLLSDDFNKSSLFWRLTSIAMVSKIYMYKYILCWLMAEAACMVSGIEDKENMYYTNINYVAFETATSFNGIIKSYNITTNNFAFKYVYRRLKFLGNIYLSQFLTLAFLSIWHGFESGYHAAFFIEFLLLYFEKNFIPIFKKFKKDYPILNSHASDTIIWILGRLYTFYFLGYGFLPFIFLYMKLWVPVFSSVYFLGHVLLGAYFLFTIVLSLFHRYPTKNETKVK